MYFILAWPPSRLFIELWRYTSKDSLRIMHVVQHELQFNSKTILYH